MSSKLYNRLNEMKNEKITKKTSNIVIRENSARRRDSADAPKVELPRP